MYVANRVQLSHGHTTPSQWHYEDTASKTADESSRGMLPKDFVEKSRWITGPDFLKEPVDSWLKEEAYENDVDPVSPEVKNVRVNTSAVEESSDIRKRLQGFSSWQKAKMALFEIQEKAQTDRFLVKRKAPDDGASEEIPTCRTSASPGVNVTDLEEAEVEIIKHVQRDAFPSEIISLQDIQGKAKYGSRELDKAKKALLKKTMSLRTLDPVLDGDRVMRVGGRITCQSI